MEKEGLAPGRKFTTAATKGNEAICPWCGSADVCFNRFGPGADMILDGTKEVVLPGECESCGVRWEEHYRAAAVSWKGPGGERVYSDEKEGRALRRARAGTGEGDA